MKNQELSLDHLPPISPLSAFEISGEISYGKSIPAKKLIKSPYLLDDLSDFHLEEPFCDVGIAWNEEALLIAVMSKKPFEDVLFPDFRSGDSIEIFIDTRDLKTTTMTRFCHHFVIFPKEIEGISAREITRFRGEENHPLCDPNLISVETVFEKKTYTTSIEIPSEALWGFQPREIPKLGFSYRINRPEKPPQHFSTSSKWFNLEQIPHLWASFVLDRSVG